MTSIAMPICIGCRHYDRTAPGPGIRCTAFPDGVPEAIFESRTDHREPYEGDRGIVFDPINAEATEYAELLFNPPTAESGGEDGDEELDASRAEVA